ncbi:MAG: hypothetical protein IIA11_01685 [Proteobacteria bacterium]|nr:hypothetical protein [Pseudomonadota bacterium]
MKAANAHGKIDYRLLGMLSDLVICSRCFRAGKVTPVPQVLSKRHTPRSLCRSCIEPRRHTFRRIVKHLN